MTGYFNVIFIKTPLGDEVIKTRSVQIAHALRRILILIDGKKNVRALMLLLNSSCVRDGIIELVNLGLIGTLSGFEEIQLESVAPEAPKLALEPVSPAPISEPQLAEIRNIMITTSHEYLGVFSKALVQDIQSANDRKRIGVLMARWKMALLESKCPNEVTAQSLTALQNLLNLDQSH